MANDGNIEALLVGKTAWNNRRASCGFKPYFSFGSLLETFRAAGKLDPNGRVCLSGFNLRDAHFHGTDLSQVDFIQADLRGAKMVGVNLQGTDFSQADLRDAEFGLGYLGAANFSSAKLENADLMQTNLSGADLGWSRYWQAKYYPYKKRTSGTDSQLKPIKSVADLIKRCFELKKRHQGFTIYFRGERNCAWPLSPSVMRRSNDDTFKLRTHEGEMLRDLISKRPEDFDGMNSALEQMVIAQHHGLKTRLLDVTRNPCVALFSACDKRDPAGNSNANNMDGRLHVFGVSKELVKAFDSDTVNIISNFAKLDWGHQSLLLGKTGKEIQAQHPDVPLQYLYSKALRRLYHFIRQEKPQFDESIDPKDFLKVFVVEPKQSFERIRAQEGAFIISAFHERFERDLIQWRVKNVPVYEYDTITVPSESKDHILDELNLLNFTRETLYPNLDEVANRITQDYL